MRALLISTYDLGRQPFGLASPAALRTAVEVHARRVVYTVRLRPDELGVALGTRLTEIVERRRTGR